MNAANKNHTKREFKKNTFAYAFALPFFILFTAFTAVPVVITIIGSFMNAGTQKWAGLANFEALFNDGLFRGALINTLLFSLCGGVICYLLSFFAAWLINEMPRAIRGVFTFIFCAPSVAADVYLMRNVVFSKEPAAPLNSMLMGLGITDLPIDWLSDGRYAFVCAALVQLWTSFGIVFLIFRAAIENVDKARYEICVIDGVKNRFGELFRITLPAIAPQALFAGVMQIVLSFTTGVLLCENTLIPLAKSAAAEFDTGRACAVCAVVFALTLTVYGVLRIVTRKVRENGEQTELPAERPMRRSKLSRAANATIFVLLAALSAVMLFPIFFTIVQSIKPTDELFRLPPRLFTARPTLSSFKELFKTTRELGVPFARYLFNSIFTALIAVVLQLAFASTAAYVLVKVKTPLTKFLNRTVETGLLFSAPVLFAARYIEMSALRITDSYAALILPLAASPLCVFLMRQTIRKLPWSLTEAARLEGASHLQTFWRVVVPNAKPTLITLALITGISAWRSTGELFVRSEELRLLPAVMRRLSENGATRAGASYAAAVLFIIPPIILLAVFQKQILKALSCAEIGAERVETAESGDLEEAFAPFDLSCELSFEKKETEEEETITEEPTEETLEEDPVREDV